MAVHKKSFSLAITNKNIFTISLVFPVWHKTIGQRTWPSANGIGVGSKVANGEFSAYSATVLYGPNMSEIQIYATALSVKSV